MAKFVKGMAVYEVMETIRQTNWGLDLEDGNEMVIAQTNSKAVVLTFTDGIVTEIAVINHWDHQYALCGD